ncbi:MAG: hypothetical protein AB7K09_21395 [Planctomycetota bacterium]
MPLPLADKRCPYCQQQIPVTDFRQHLADVHQVRPREEPSPPPSPPPSGSHRVLADLVADAPRVYVHEFCGASTRMPDDAIGNYLRDPYCYPEAETWCTACNAYVPYRDCRWQESGQWLDAYMRELQLAHGPPPGPGAVRRRMADTRRFRDEVYDEPAYREPRPGRRSSRGAAAARNANNQQVKIALIIFGIVMGLGLMLSLMGGRPRHTPAFNNSIFEDDDDDPFFYEDEDDAAVREFREFQESMNAARNNSFRSSNNSRNAGNTNNSANRRNRSR